MLEHVGARFGQNPDSILMHLNIVGNVVVMHYHAVLLENTEARAGHKIIKSQNHKSQNHKSTPWILLSIFFSSAFAIFM